MQRIDDLSERALEKELRMVPAPDSPGRRHAAPQALPLPLPLPLPAPRGGAKASNPKPKSQNPQRNFVLDNVVNSKAALEIKLKKAQDAEERKDKLAFGPGARDMRQAQPAAAGVKQARHKPEAPSGGGGGGDGASAGPKNSDVNLNQANKPTPSHFQHEQLQLPPPAALQQASAVYVPSSQSSYLQQFGRVKGGAHANPSKARRPAADDHFGDDVSSITASMYSARPQPALPALSSARR